MRVRIVISCAMFLLICVTPFQIRAFSQNEHLVRKITEEYCVFPDDSAQLIREERVKKLSELGEEARLTLLELANSEDKECALYYLYRLEDPRILPILRRIIADDEEPERLRRISISYLGGLNDVESLNRILEFVESNDRTTVNQTILALGGIDDDTAREALRGLARQEKYVVFLSSIVRSIGRQEDKEAVDLLIEILEMEAVTKEDTFKGEIYGIFRDTIHRDVATALMRIGTKRSRELALGVAQQVRDEYRRKGAIREMRNVLVEQRKRTEEPDEIAEINRIMDLLKSF